MKAAYQTLGCLNPKAYIICSKDRILIITLDLVTETWIISSNRIWSDKPRKIKQDFWYRPPADLCKSVQELVLSTAKERRETSCEKHC